MGGRRRAGERLGPASTTPASAGCARRSRSSRANLRRPIHRRSTTTSSSNACARINDASAHGRRHRRRAGRRSRCCPSSISRIRRRASRTLRVVHPRRVAQVGTRAAALERCPASHRCRLRRRRHSCRGGARADRRARGRRFSCSARLVARARARRLARRFDADRRAQRRVAASTAAAPQPLPEWATGLPGRGRGCVAGARDGARRGRAARPDAAEPSFADREPVPGCRPARAAKRGGARRPGHLITAAAPRAARVQRATSRSVVFINGRKYVEGERSPRGRNSGNRADRAALSLHSRTALLASVQVVAGSSLDGLLDRRDQRLVVLAPILTAKLTGCTSRARGRLPDELRHLGDTALGIEPQRLGVPRIKSGMLSWTFASCAFASVVTIRRSRACRRSGCASAPTSRPAASNGSLAGMD